MNHTTTLSVGAGDQLLTTTITDAGSNDGITLDGGGTLVLDGPASYGGPTDVESGTLDIESNVPSVVTVAAGGVIEGDGSAGSITGNGGTLSLGNDSSIYTLTAGSVSLGNGTTLQEELASNNGSESDGEMAVTSTPVNLNGAALDVSTQNGFMPAVGDVITLISNQTGSAVTGTFTGLAQGAVAMFGGLEYQLSYDGGQSGHDVTLTRVAHDPTYLAFVQQPSNAVAGGSLGTVSVEVLDAYGYLMAGDTSVVTVAGTSLRGTGSVAAVNGVATFSGLSMTQAGTRSLTATDAQLTPATSNPFTITAGAATQLVFAQQPGNAAAGSPVGTVVVDVEDAYGNLVTTDNSAVTISGAGLGGTQTVTAVNGVATFTGLSLTQAGTHSLGATDGQLTQAISNPVTITPAAAAKLVFAQQPISAATNASVGTVVVDVEDAYGNLVTNDNSAVTISSSASLAGTQTVSAANGVATFTDLSVTQAGVFTLSANDGSLTGATSNTITITHPVKITVDAYASMVSTDSNTGTLHVEAVEVGGDNSDLTYTWSILSQPTGVGSANKLRAEEVGSPAPMAMFAINGTNAAKDTPVTFLAAGEYTLQVVVSNGAQSATSQVQVTTKAKASTATVAAQTTRVAGVQPISSGQSISGFVVSFTGALDPATAQNVMGYRILRQYTTGDKLHFAQWLFGIDPGTQTETSAYKIASAVYDSQTYSVTLTLASAMPMQNGVRLVQVIGTGAHAVLGANGKAIDGDFNGKPGGNFTYRFTMSVASTVSYKTTSGDLVKLSLTGPGKIVTIMPSNTATPVIDLLGTNPADSILTGTLHKGRKGLGYAVIDQLNGSASADVQLGDEFHVNAVE